jgi:hypothetical protein
MEIGSGLALGFGSLFAAWVFIKMFGKFNANGYMTKETCGIITKNHNEQLRRIEEKVQKIDEKVDKILLRK